MGEYRKLALPVLGFAKRIRKEYIRRSMTCLAVSIFVRVYFSYSGTRLTYLHGN